jgi:nucleotide-binding universal stress UspA family protein
LPKAFQSSEPILREGPPGDRILEVLHEERANLAIVGAHEQSRVGRLLLGSVSDRVLNHAPCSVLVVREKQ